MAKEEKSVEEKRFDRAYKRALGLIEKVREDVSESTTVKPSFARADRAVTKLECDLAGFVSEEKREAAYSLRAKLIKARDEATKARSELRDAEIARLREAVREENAKLTTYEREIRVMKGGRL